MCNTPRNPAHHPKRSLCCVLQINFIFNHVCAHVSVGALSGQKMASDPLQLGLQRVVSDSVGAGIELRFSRRTARALGW